MNNKTTGINYRVAGLVLTIMVLAAGVIATFATNTAKQVDLTDDLVELKADGCDKSDKNREDIIVLQSDVKYIRRGIDDIKELVKKE